MASTVFCLGCRSFWRSTYSDSRQLLSRSKRILGFRDYSTQHSDNPLPSIDITNRTFRERIKSGPSFHEFLKDQTLSTGDLSEVEETQQPYLDPSHTDGKQRKVFIETYGCQMNVNDTEIAWSILLNSGYAKAKTVEDSDVILLMTCSIREGAESKIWNRLEYLKHLKRIRPKNRVKIGILGCMAERLKAKIVEQEKLVDLVCGPDAYRDLPKMLAETNSGQAAVNVLLSLDETYADVVPVRVNENAMSAFVSIMRGCDNMCTYCIVPFTRGRERSRPMKSIVDEVKHLSDQGIKEITLLGQNVNSYRDLSEVQFSRSGEETRMAKGFSSVYKAKKGGQRFADLLHRVSQVDAEMRIRFTSPHPKDFPDQVLEVIKEQANICNQLHMPAQSGSTRVLGAMGRGYTQQAYLELVDRVRQYLPGVALSSDFIAGFCGETEEDHQATMELIKRVKYDFAFCFPYSMRQKTRAFRRLHDDVPDSVKRRRHMELYEVIRAGALEIKQQEIGNLHLVLVEGRSKKSEQDLAGRNESNAKVIFPRVSAPVDVDRLDGNRAEVNPGDYVIVQITSYTSQTYRGEVICHSSLRDFNSRQISLAALQQS